MREDGSGKERGQILSRALRAIRKIRPKTSRELAKALGLSLRGYQNFEAGGGQLNVDHVLKFAATTDSDPMGILTSVQIKHPEFAAYVARNKAMVALNLTLQEFVEEVGDGVALLDTATYLSAYRAMFRDLARQAEEARQDRDAWDAFNAEKLGLPPKPTDED